MAEFEEKLSQRPQILVCNVEFLSSKKVVKGLLYRIFIELPLQVKDVIVNTRLSPRGHRPIVCIDEAQMNVNVEN